MKVANRRPIVQNRAAAILHIDWSAAKFPTRGDAGDRLAGDIAQQIQMMAAEPVEKSHRAAVFGIRQLMTGIARNKLLVVHVISS